MNIKITKITNEDLLRKANRFTTGKKSNQSLKSAYRSKHSTIRTQLFYVECYGIPQFVAYHLRTHFSLYPMPPFEYGWMRSKRTDKGGPDFNQVCRDLAFGISTEFIGKENLPAKELSGEYNRWADAVESLPEHFDRMAPTDFGFMISAEGLMNLAEKRLCFGAVSKETREVVEAICELVKECDPDLYPFLVRPCVASGVCRESCCGFINTENYKDERKNYKSLFKTKHDERIN